MVFPDLDPAKSSGSTFTIRFLRAYTFTSGIIYYYDKALSSDTETGPGSDSKLGDNEDPCFPLLSIIKLCTILKMFDRRSRLFNKNCCEIC
jgi:hypothetical protein